MGPAAGLDLGRGELIAPNCRAVARSALLRIAGSEGYSDCSAATKSAGS